MSSINKYLPVAGLLAVAFYLAHVILGGALWPGYSHLAQPISDLTANGAPNRQLILVLTWIYGGLALIFAIGQFSLYRPYRRGSLTLGLSLFIALHIVSLSYGLFPEDLGGGAVSFSGFMHIVVTCLLVPFTIAAPIVIGAGIKGVSRRPVFGNFSIICGCLIFVLGGISVVAMANKLAFFGLIERLNIGTLMLWMTVFALFSLRNPPPAIVSAHTIKETSVFASRKSPIVSHAQRAK